MHPRTDKGGHGAGGWVAHEAAGTSGRGRRQPAAPQDRLAASPLNQFPGARRRPLERWRAASVTQHTHLLAHPSTAPFSPTFPLPLAFLLLSLHLFILPFRGIASPPSLPLPILLTPIIHKLIDPFPLPPLLSLPTPFHSPLLNIPSHQYLIHSITHLLPSFYLFLICLQSSLLSPNVSISTSPSPPPSFPRHSP